MANKFLPAFLSFQDRPSQNNDDAKKNISKTVLPVKLARIKQDALNWRAAIDEAERPFNPFRVQMQQIFIDTVLDGHVKACMRRRKDLTMLRDWEIVDASGTINENAMALIDKTWFSRFLSHSLDALFFGYSLIELGDITNNEFNNIKVTKRWHVSPDRKVVSNMAYNISGAPFLEEPYVDWHVWVSTPNDIGTSDCGFGALYEVAIYQIFLRNLLGFNGDFLELFGQPIRVGRTSKIEEAERGAFYEALRDMGSAGFILLDELGDNIELIESSSIGNSYKAYENFELRLQKLISKLLLGHADAMDSVAGKLGASQGEDSPTYQALEDTQSNDGNFIIDVINSSLFPKLRKLGFALPEGLIFRFTNDSELHEKTERLTEMAVKIKSAGLQMDKAYYEENTNIKLSDLAVVLPKEPIQSVKDKIKNLYR